MVADYLILPIFNQKSLSFYWTRYQPQPQMIMIYIRGCESKVFGYIIYLVPETSCLLHVS